MKKRLLITVAIALVLLLAVPLTAFFAYMNLASPGSGPVNTHYLSYDGNATQVYLVSTTTSYDMANESYTTPAGQTVQLGTPLFVATVTLRNDYTSDHPPPPLPNEPPISPADGTAYVYLTAQLYNKDGEVNATNVSVSDFSLPLTPGTGLVLASGQTASAEVYMATNHTDITKFEVNLIFVGDSIPP